MSDKDSTDVADFAFERLMHSDDSVTTSTTSHIVAETSGAHTALVGRHVSKRACTDEEYVAREVVI